MTSSNGTAPHGAILADTPPEGGDTPIVELRNAGKSYGNIRA
ncbi:sugar ABC transporter ATP-binding protein, partial [Streptomyces sp. NPDC006476]